jgi:hypothetical protein
VQAAPNLVCTVLRPRTTIPLANVRWFHRGGKARRVFPAGLNGGGSVSAITPKAGVMLHCGK